MRSCLAFYEAYLIERNYDYYLKCWEHCCQFKDFCKALIRGFENYDLFILKEIHSRKGSSSERGAGRMCRSSCALPLQRSCWQDSTLMWNLDGEFDRVTFAGVFRRKVEAELLRPSRFVCFHFRNIRFPDVEKVTLLSYYARQTVLLFTDIYGTGLNWVTRNDTDMAHTDFIRTVARDMFLEHGLEADDNGKLMSDAVYLPFDDEAYINPKYLEAEFDKPQEGRWSSFADSVMKYDD